MFNQKHPFFSVIVICYNSENTIEKCINSIFSQTYKQFDIICVNDGSTDNTLSLLNKFAKSDNCVRIFSQKNNGRGSARNLGIKNSTSQFILFVDSDDFVDKDFLLHAYDTIQLNKTDLIIYDIKYQNELLSASKNKIINERRYIEEKVYCFYRSQSVISCIFGRNLFLDNKIYFPMKKSFEDFFVLYKLINCSKNPLISQNKFYSYTPTNESVTNNLCDEDLSNIIDSFYDFNNFIKLNKLDRNIFTERFNNAFKFIISKLAHNNQFDVINAEKIIIILVTLSEKFSISNESLYYNIYLLLRYNKSALKFIESKNFFNSKIITFFNSIIAENKKLASSVIDFLKKENITYVSIIGIGNALLESVQLLKQNNISVNSIYTDLYLNQPLGDIPLYSLNEINKITSSYVIVGSYISAEKYTRMVTKYCRPETRALNFYNVLEN
ncbi:glycosyltransferase family 2 protein [Opitutales bacterium]|nr:glycosyltransferase family 2 protein [Opitutales bacterium]